MKISSSPSRNTTDRQISRFSAPYRLMSVRGETTFGAPSDAAVTVKESPSASLNTPSWNSPPGLPR